jgi:EmrB/QacA subfamily drug resistance transporter
LANRPINQKAAVSVVFVAAIFMSIMDATIVNVALPTLARSFKVSLASVDTIVIAYLVSLAVFIPASGWLGDRLGARRVLLIAVVIFTLASAACGVAQSTGQLVVFRIVQGAAGGMLAPVGMSMLYRTFPPAERIRASAILTVPTTFAPALGPVVGGLLVTDLSWRWVFYVNLPIGIAVVVFGLVFLDEQPQADPGRFDLPGFALAGVGLGSLMYGVSEGPLHGWGTPAVLISVAVGAVLLAGLVGRELGTPAPLIDFRLLASRVFRSANGIMFFATMAFLGVLYVVPLFLQEGRHTSALTSGLASFPEAIGVMVGAQVATRAAYPRLGPRRLIFLGLLVVTAAMASMALLGTGSSLWWVRSLMFLMGLGMAQVFVPCQAAAFADITPAATASASTFFNTQRQVGSAIGVAVVSTLLAGVGLAHGLHAYHVAFLTAAALALLAAGLALTIHDEDAGSTRAERKLRPTTVGAPAAG